MMRLLLLLSALVGIAVPCALAQVAEPATTGGSRGEVDFGARLNTVRGESADGLGRFHQFRDLRSGPLLNRFRYTLEQDRWTFAAAMDRPGYRDQRLGATVENVGRFSARFAWDQVPLLYGETARTPFTSNGRGELRLDDATQRAVQDRTGTVAAFGAFLQPVALRSRRDVADMGIRLSATRNLDLTASLRSTARRGTQPWGATFGFSNAIEVAVPLSHRTNDLATAAEWSNRRGLVKLAYDGSWFRNDVETLTWDNPLRVTDQTYATAYSVGDGSSQGRMALWPSSSAHTVSATASVALPARTRAVGAVSLGTWLQDADLLPHTINSAIAPIPLDRSSAEAEARIVSMNYRLTSRPTRTLWLTGQFRLYDYDNRTPRLPLQQYVRLDGVAAPSATGGNEPFGYSRQFVDLDASFTPVRYTAFRVGYGRERDDRTFRLFETTTENTLRASVDTTGAAWGSVRVQYDHAVRTGEGLDEQVLSDIGEQVSLRQFDISDRTRDRVSAIVQVLPRDWLGLNTQWSVGREGRPDAAFGLQDNDVQSVAIGVDVTSERLVTAGVTYSLEHYATAQRSRQANPGVQFNDPTRDWSTEMDERVHTVSASVELPRVTRIMAVSAGYDDVRSRARYLYVLPPVSTLVAPVQLSPVRNRIQRATGEARFSMSPRVTLATGYWLDAYDVEDFALSPGTLNSALLPGFLNVGYVYRPYVVHTGFVRVIYRWQ